MSYSIYNPTNVTYGNLTVGAASTSASQYVWHGTSAGTSATDWTIYNNNPVTITQKATVELTGEDADVVINGESLRDSIREIKEALRIPSKLNRDPKLEKDWEELQAAGDHYQKLLKEYREKQKVWDALNGKFDK